MRLKQLSLSVMSLSLAMALTSNGFAAGNYKENYKGEAMPIPCPPHVMLNGGFYFGGQAGYDSYRVTDSTATIVNPVDGSSLSLDPDISANGAAIGVFAGYGYYFDKFYRTYLALEVYANSTSADTGYELFAVTDTTNELTARFKPEYNVGVSILPGIKLNNNALLYVRLGYNWAQISTPEDFYLDGAHLINSNATKEVGGFQYGLGIEGAFDRNWSVRLEYNHTDFNKYSTGVETDIKTTDNQFMLGLVYHIHDWP
ncbi:MAG TPA: outer membrane beta-barrel protein [Gammaproteobacteria bacterium]|jgi:outer membrane immunogenic protein|nr:outer membrane beta-barrel protein [Gammaproteobacteria bacterium]